MYSILAIIALLLLWYIKNQIEKAGSGLLQGLGLKDSDEDKAINKDVEKLTISAFSPKFFQTPTAAKNKATILTKAYGDKLAKKLKESHGFANDNEEQFVDVFKALKTKSQVSHLAHIFSLNYNLDMLTFVQDYFGDEWGTDANKEYNAVIKYVASLPDYKA